VTWTGGSKDYRDAPFLVLWRAADGSEIHRWICDDLDVDERGRYVLHNAADGDLVTRPPIILALIFEPRPGEWVEFIGAREWKALREPYPPTDRIRVSTTKEAR